jgi:hypothetical protein
MKNKGFKLEPLKSYSQIKYPSQTKMKTLKNSVIAGGLLILATGCTNDSEKCDGDKIICENDNIAIVCNENAPNQIISCDQYCKSLFGDFSISLGCQENFNQPCQCEYDIILGSPSECIPGEIFCIDSQNVNICTDFDGYSDYKSMSCVDFCKENYGSEYYPYGDCSDTNAENPCQCEYEIIAGIDVACYPGDIYCFDENTLLECDGNINDYQRINCSDRCLEQNGENSISNGCDASNDVNPCLCD